MAKEISTGKDRASGTVDPEEVARFSALSERWWEKKGPFQPLHRLNPTRIAYIRDRLCTHFDRDATSLSSLKGVKSLDVGCGGGLLTEPLTRLGAEVMGVDVSEENINVARQHAANSGLEIDYQVTTVENLAQSGQHFDAVFAMEVIEHVADREAFFEACAALIKPGGVMFVATLNRTLKAFVFAIVGAEYVMRLLPRGTHEWDRFVRPSELSRYAVQHELSLAQLTGVTFNPFDRVWALSRDTSVNYMAFLVKNTADTDSYPNNT